MKKTIFAIITMILVSTGINAQKKGDKEPPPYYGSATLMINLAKPDSVNPGKNFDIDFLDYYGHFGFRVTWSQPLNNKRNWGLRQLKTATLGYAFHKSLAFRQSYDAEKYHLMGMIGITGALTPKQDTGNFKMKNNNDFFIGGSGALTLIGESSGLEANLKVMYVVLPRNNDTIWTENVLSPEIDAKKFFGSHLGIWAKYRLMLYTSKEQQVRGRPYYATTVSNSRSEISAGICGKWNIKTAAVTCIVGVVIPREKFKVSDNTNSPGWNFFNASTGKTTLSAGVQISFHNPPSN